MTFFLRVCSGTIFALLVAALHTSAQATPVNTAQLEADVCPLHPNAEILAALQKNDPTFQCSHAPAHAAAKPAPASDQVTGYHPKATSPTKASPPPPALYAEYPVPLFMVRNDWTDLGLLGAGCVGPAGVSADKAKGASVSFTRDYAGNNKIWAAQGMAAAVYSDCWNVPLQRGGSYSGWLEKSIGVYAQINSDYNSNATLAKKNNLDTRTAGLSGELAYVHGADINVVRITPNVVFDNIKGTTSVAMLAQYAPVWLSLPYIWTDYRLFGDFSLQFDPTLDLQYASATGHSQPLQFSGKDQSLRLGPELTFIIKPLNISGSDLSHIGINETFHPWYEVYNGHGSYWWANSIFYNFDDAGNFAVALSYNRGLDENSGTMTNQYVASLTGKY